MENRDKLLTETMGLKYHRIIECRHDSPLSGRVLSSICMCGRKIEDSRGNKRECYANQDFSTPQGFFKLFNFATKQEWWNEFIEQSWQSLKSGEFQPDWVDDQIGIRLDFINPDNLANAIFSYLKEKNNGH